MGHQGSITLLDMAVVDPDSEAVLLWHYGVTPPHFAHQNVVRWVDHTRLGRKSDVKYGVAGDVVFAPQETTITYLSKNAFSLEQVVIAIPV